jgi:hypothetical protein
MQNDSKHLDASQGAGVVQVGCCLGLVVEKGEERAVHPTVCRS